MECLQVLVLCSVILKSNSFIFPMHNFNLGKVLEDKPMKNIISFHLYHKNNLKKNEELFVDDIAALEKSHFNRILPVKFLIHGWTDSKDSSWLVEMREVMASTGKWNVIVVNWAPLSHTSYSEARVHIKLVSDQIKSFTIFLKKYKALPFSLFHYIGHSLGAHISGYAGSAILQEYNETIGRITGLDPARPLFEWPYIDPYEEKLDESDAAFVDVIHTNAKELGISEPAGHVDYYPNGGSKQPGCGSMICNHMRACEYWTASIKNPSAFNAYPSKSWNAYLQGYKCMLPRVPMGIAANNNIPSGLYFLITKDKPPHVYKKTVIY